MRSLLKASIRSISYFHRPLRKRRTAEHLVRRQVDAVPKRSADTCPEKNDHKAHLHASSLECEAAKTRRVAGWLLRALPPRRGVASLSQQELSAFIQAVIGEPHPHRFDSRRALPSCQSYRNRAPFGKRDTGTPGETS